MRFFPRNGTHQFDRFMIRFGQNPIVKKDQKFRNQNAHQQHGSHHPQRRNPSRFHRGDFLIPRKPPESHQAGYKNRHRNRQGKHPDDIQRKNFQHGRNRQPFRQNIVENSHQKIHDKKECDDKQRKQKGRYMFFQHIPNQNHKISKLIFLLI